VLLLGSQLVSLFRSEVLKVSVGHLHLISRQTVLSSAELYYLVL